MKEQQIHRINLHMHPKSSGHGPTIQAHSADKWKRGIECLECGTRMKYKLGQPHEEWAQCECWENSPCENLFQSEEDRAKWLAEERVKA